MQQINNSTVHSERTKGHRANAINYVMVCVGLNSQCDVLHFDCVELVLLVQATLDVVGRG